MEATGHILIVDDEVINRELLEDLLDSLGLASKSAENGPQALDMLSSETDLVLLDVMMPGMNGFEVARHIRCHPLYNEAPIIMVTALNSKQDRLRAVDAGANDFIEKPVDKLELKVRTASLLRMKAARDALRRHQAGLEATVEDRTAKLREALESLEDAQQKTYIGYLDTIKRLALASEYKDACTGFHLVRVSHYCALLGRAAGLPAADLELLFHASAMHDVGKLGIPDTIILKPGTLTREERAIMQQHTTIGARILSGSESALLKAGEIIALTHHEKWDGTGYPSRIAGKDIPQFGRICAIADVFDALTTQRSYKPAFAFDEAVRILRVGRGTHFDPSLVDLFLCQAAEIQAVQSAYADPHNAPQSRLGNPDLAA